MDINDFNETNEALAVGEQGKKRDASGAGRPPSVERETFGVENGPGAVERSEVDLDEFEFWLDLELTDDRFASDVDLRLDDESL